jgi:hypothetical protein
MVLDRVLALNGLAGSDLAVGKQRRRVRSVWQAAQFPGSGPLWPGPEPARPILREERKMTTKEKKCVVRFKPSELEIERALERQSRGLSRDSVFGPSRPFYMFIHRNIRILGRWVGQSYVEIHTIEEIDEELRPLRLLSEPGLVVRIGAGSVDVADCRCLAMARNIREAPERDEAAIAGEEPGGEELRALQREKLCAAIRERNRPKPVSAPEWMRKPKPKRKGRGAKDTGTRGRGDTGTRGRGDAETR